MGKVKRLSLKLLLLITAIACLSITVINYINIPINTNGTLYIPKQFHSTYYEMLSDNVGMTTINGLGNVYVNMEADGYEIYNEEITDHTIDVTFVKSDFPTYRYYYEYPSGRLTFFSSEYENSFIGSSYIIDESIKEVQQ